MEENKLLIQNELSSDEIKNLIYTIRGKQVMLDSDVGKLYHYETKRINETVKRNIERFPIDFCFQLTSIEYNSLKSHIATSNNRGGKQKLPYVFTEKSILMLSGLLKNEIAIEISIRIVEAFIEMRKFIYANGQLFERLTNVEFKLLEHDKKFNQIFNQLQQEENIKQKIFFEGQIYDAYSIIIDIIKKANKKILIIDNYIDDSILKMLSKKKNNVEVYHLGASIKDLGKKCFGINKIEDLEIIRKFIEL